MSQKHLDRLLRPALVLVCVSGLAWTACNSNSVSGNEPSAAHSTNTEVKSAVNAETKASAGPRSQGLLGAAISSVK